MRISDWSSDVCSSDLRRVGTVHGVGVDRVGEVGADGARGGVLRIGGAHQLAVLRDRVVAFEHLDHHRAADHRSEEHTSELQSLMRISYAVFCLKKQIKTNY